MLAFDYPAIQAVVLVIAMISLFVYLALDVVHAMLDRGCGHERLSPDRNDTAGPGPAGAHVARPLPDLLFRLGGLIVVMRRCVLMVAGPWLTPFDIGRPSDDIMLPPPDLH